MVDFQALVFIWLGSAEQIDFEQCAARRVQPKIGVSRITAAQTWSVTSCPYAQREEHASVCPHCVHGLSRCPT